MNAFYSSNGVDQLIAPYLPHFGYAAEVGAGDGIGGSNCKHFEDKGWRVLCIEANPKLAEAGRKVRKTWLPVACGSSPKDAVEFKIVWDYPWGSYSGFHTHEIPTVLNAPPLGTMATAMVPVDTLNRMLDAEQFPELNLLTIDVEGHEVEVLKGLDLDRWRPQIIVAEAWDAAATSALVSHLSPHSYVLDHVLHQDCVFTRRTK